MAKKRTNKKSTAAKPSLSSRSSAPPKSRLHRLTHHREATPHPPVNPNKVQSPLEYSQRPHPAIHLLRCTPAMLAHERCSRLRQRVPERFAVAYHASRGKELQWGRRLSTTESTFKAGRQSSETRYPARTHRVSVVILQCVEKLFDCNFRLFQNMAKSRPFHWAMSRDRDPQSPLRQRLLQSNVTAPLPDTHKPKPHQRCHDPLVALRGNLAHQCAPSPSLHPARPDVDGNRGAFTESISNTSDQQWGRSVFTRCGKGNSLPRSPRSRISSMELHAEIDRAERLLSHREAVL